MQAPSAINMRQYPKGLQLPARLISSLLHPVFMPTIMAIVVCYLNRPQFAAVSMQERVQWLGNIALNTLFFPLLATLLMKALGFIESIQMKTSRDRIIPLMATMIFYFWAYHIFRNIGAPLLLKVLLLGSFWGIIVLFLINIFFKISMHTAAAGGAVGILIVLMSLSQVNLVLPFLLALLVAGMIGTARMILHAHRPVEIWAGYAVGLGVQLGAYWFLS